MFEASVGIGVVVALVRRVDLGALATLRIRGLWLCPLAFVLKVALFYLSYYRVGLVVAYGPWLQLALTVALLLIVAINLHVTGMKIVLVGLLCNMLVIAINGGRMPVTLSAVQASGRTSVIPVIQAGEDPAHVMAKDDTRLVFLSDWIPLRFLDHETVSPGDIVAAVGLLAVVGFSLRRRKERDVVAGQAS